MNIFPFSPDAIKLRSRRELRNAVWSLLISSLASIAVLGFLIITKVGGASPRLLVALVSPVLSVDGWLSLVAGAIPLWLSAIAFSIPFLVGFYNIGAEGQISISGFLTAAIGLIVASFLSPGHGATLVWLFACAVGIIGSVGWGLMALSLRDRFHANEVITTLLMNFIAAILVNYLVNKPLWADASAQGVQTRGLPFWLLDAVSKGDLGACSIVAILFLVAAHIFIWWTRWGLSLRAVGKSAEAAEFCGMDVSGLRYSAVCFGGIAAGLVGVSAVVASGSFNAEKVAGWGFDGIAVAILGQHRLPGILLAGLFLSLWRLLSSDLQLQAIPFEVYLIVQALLIIFYLLSSRTRE